MHGAYTAQRALEAGLLDEIQIHQIPVLFGGGRRLFDVSRSATRARTVDGSIGVMTSVAGDFELTMDELRVVARFVAESAQEVLPVFEEAVPGDRRPRAAVDAA